MIGRNVIARSRGLISDENVVGWKMIRTFFNKTLLLLLLSLSATVGRGQEAPGELTREAFAKLSEEISEPGGYFDTDNLISNEASYLHVLGRMREMGVSGGVFIGVGPDQSFSYIAATRPRIAFLIDIRRDNLLQHLFYKALFELARNRIEFLSLLFGRPLPTNPADWEHRPVAELADLIGRTRGDTELLDRSRRRIEERLNTFNFRLTQSDVATIRRIHEQFVINGIELRFTSHNRAPRYYYPTYRDLILERDLTGMQGSFLAREDSFRAIKSLQEKNLLIPVVGNLAGARSLKAIGRYIAQRGMSVSTLYTSNVEYYLMREDEFAQFGRNVSALPRGSRSVLIRSFFNGSWGRAHPMAVPGYYSTQLLQTLDSFVSEFAAGGYRDYGEVVSRGLLRLK